MRQKRLDVDPPGPPRRDRDQSELIMQNVEDQHRSHQIGRREVSSNIHQTAPIGSPSGPVPGQQLILSLRMPPDQLFRLAPGAWWISIAP